MESINQESNSSNFIKIDHLAFTIFHGFYNFNNMEKLEILTDDVKGFSDEKLASQNLYRLIVLGYLSIIVLVFGLLGNLINIIVLSNRKMRELPINCLFLGLSFSDSFLLAVFSCLVIPTILSYYELVDYTLSKLTYILPSMYALAFTSHTMSVMFILLVTLERYLAVCHPFKSRVLSSPRRVYYATFGVTLLSILLNVCRWLEFEVIVQKHPIDGTLIYLPVTSELRKNPTYEKYIFINYIILNWLIPIVTTLVLNTLILKRIYTANKERQTLSQSQKCENQLSIMLLIVVGVFLICNTLFLVNIIGKFVTGSSAVFGVDSMRNFLWILNASVNFIIYCAYGRKFREVFYELCHILCFYIISFLRRLCNGRCCKHERIFGRSTFYGDSTSTDTGIGEGSVESNGELRSYNTINFVDAHMSSLKF